MAVLLLGGFTALLGIAHAAVGTDLATVVAYSSVENGGLICVGYGIAVVGAAVGEPGLVAAALLAATLQFVAHTLRKSLLVARRGPPDSPAWPARGPRCGRYGPDTDHSIGVR